MRRCAMGPGRTSRRGVVEVVNRPGEKDRPPWRSRCHEIRRRSGVAGNPGRFALGEAVRRLLTAGYSMTGQYVMRGFPAPFAGLRRNGPAGPGRRLAL